MLIQMQGTGIVDIETDIESSGGCETCDYGSSYINYFTVKMTTGILSIEIDNMYEYCLSEGDLMVLFTSNYEKIQQMDEKTFIRWVKQILREKYGEEYEAIDFEFCTVTFDTNKEAKELLDNNY